jgi:hypothetical protein
MKKYQLLGVIILTLSSVVSAAPLNNDNIHYFDEDVEKISKYIRQADMAKDDLERKKIQKKKEQRKISRGYQSKSNNDELKYIPNPNIVPIPINEGIQDILIQEINYKKNR